MQRTIEIADFELPRGAITIEQLMGMENAAWEHLRAEINLRRKSAPDQPLARCRLCKCPVYIRAQSTRDGLMPLFAHFSDADPHCPWYSGINLIPDDARAAQYKGHQECALHRWMCDTIAHFLGQDPRASGIAVDHYLKPAIEDRGRFPDVFAQIAGLGKFAFEVQLAKPFAFEIAARHQHYRSEDVALIWVFRNLDAQLPQGFRDVITMQRGNAFLFDDAAFRASVDSGRLMLTAYLESEKGWLKPRLVSLDDLDRRNGRSVFVEDRRTDKLLDYCKAGRVKWLPLLEAGAPFDFDDRKVEDSFGPAWDSIRAFISQLSGWKDSWWRQFETRGRPHFFDVMSMLFSIQSSAETGSDRVFVTRYKNDGALVAMLNARLSGAMNMRYADLIETMLAGTSRSYELDRPSLRTALANARQQVQQIAPGHPLWASAGRLFPEVFDGVRRAELTDLGQLPTWAIASKISTSEAT